MPWRSSAAEPSHGCLHGGLTLSCEDDAESGSSSHAEEKAMSQASATETLERELERLRRTASLAGHAFACDAEIEKLASRPDEFLDIWHLPGDEDQTSEGAVVLEMPVRRPGLD